MAVLLRLVHVSLQQQGCQHHPQLKLQLQQQLMTPGLLLLRLLLMKPSGPCSSSGLRTSRIVSSLWWAATQAASTTTPVTPARDNSARAASRPRSRRSVTAPG